LRTRNAFAEADKDTSALSLLFLLAKVLVFAGKLLYSARRIHDLLFARKEGMATRTNIHRVVFSSGGGLKGSSTGAGNGDIMNLRVNVFFHQFNSSNILV
jgi:hypothetical protein